MHVKTVRVAVERLIVLNRSIHSLTSFNCTPVPLRCGYVGIFEGGVLEDSDSANFGRIIFRRDVDEGVAVLVEVRLGALTPIPDVPRHQVGGLGFIALSTVVVPIMLILVWAVHRCSVELYSLGLVSLSAACVVVYSRRPWALVDHQR
jgi:hypothetical protein